MPCILGLVCCSEAVQHGVAGCTCVAILHFNIPCTTLDTAMLAYAAVANLPAPARLLQATPFLLRLHAAKQDGPCRLVLSGSAAAAPARAAGQPRRQRPHVPHTSPAERPRSPQASLVSMICAESQSGPSLSLHHSWMRTGLRHRRHCVQHGRCTVLCTDSSSSSCPSPNDSE